MVSFPEKNDDPSSRLITGGRAKNDDVKNGANKSAVNH